MVELAGNKSKATFRTALAALAAVYFILTVLMGRALLLSGHMWPPDILFGCDIARNIDALSKPFGFPDANPRSNVHPLFAFIFKPLGLAIESAGITPAIAAIIATAAAGTLSLLLTAWYFRRRGVGRGETLLVTALAASSMAMLFHGAVPGTYLFSSCLIVLNFIFLGEVLRRPEVFFGRRAVWLTEAGWVLIGVLQYGITVTNGMTSTLIYGFTRRGWRAWLRAGVYGAIVLATGLLLTKAAGSIVGLQYESKVVADESFKGVAYGNPFWQSLTTMTLWSVVAPIPEILRIPGQDRLMASFQHSQFTPLGWVLAVAWLCLFAMAAYACWKDGDPVRRRLSAALAACLAYQIVLHSFYIVYWEGVFVYTPHSFFMLIGLLAPLMIRARQWPASQRRLLHAVILGAAVCLAIRHVELILSLRSLVPLP